MERIEQERDGIVPGEAWQVVEGGDLHQTIALQYSRYDGFRSAVPGQDPDVQSALVVDHPHLRDLRRRAVFQRLALSKAAGYRRTLPHELGEQAIQRDVLGLRGNADRDQRGPHSPLRR